MTDNWQTDTPPKDGREFLAYDPDVVDPTYCPEGVVVAFWAEQVHQVAADRFEDAFIGAVWNEDTDGWEATVIHPAAWIPKPAAPASA